MKPSEERRPVRSYVRREGRLTKAQREALERLWPVYGVDYTTTQLDLDELFGRRARRALEIGFGNGESLAKLAGAYPETDFLGIEVHRPGVGHLFLLLEREGLDNVRVFCHDAIEVLADQLPDETLAEVMIWFPDPWPKKRHHKRRLLQVEFVELLARKIVSGGRLRVATDWRNYAEQIENVLEQSRYFDPQPGARHERPQTKFERRGLTLGHDVWDFIYVRNTVPVDRLSIP